MYYRLIIVLSLFILSSAAHAWETEYYAGFSFGNISLEKDSAEIKKTLDASQWPGAIAEVGEPGTITKAYAGAFITKSMGVRLAYVNLGDVNLGVATGVPAGDEREFANAVLNALPNTGAGVAISLQGRFPISDTLIIHDWAGLFFWESESKLNLSETNSALAVVKSNSGADFMLGGAIEYVISNQFGVRLEAERYNQDGDGVTMLGLGAAYYF